MTRLKNAAATVVGLCLGLVGFALFASVGLAVVGALAVVALLGGIAAGVATSTTPDRSPIDISWTPRGRA